MVSTPRRLAKTSTQYLSTQCFLFLGPERWPKSRVIFQRMESAHNQNSISAIRSERSSSSTLPDTTCGIGTRQSVCSLVRCTRSTIMPQRRRPCAPQCGAAPAPVECHARLYNLFLSLRDWNNSDDALRDVLLENDRYSLNDYFHAMWHGSLDSLLQGTLLDEKIDDWRHGNVSNLLAASLHLLEKFYHDLRRGNFVKDAFLGNGSRTPARHPPRSQVRAHRRQEAPRSAPRCALEGCPAPPSRSPQT